MSFNSLEFAIFAVIFFSLYPLFKSEKQKRWLFLTFFSLLFYSLGDWRYLPLLLISGHIDFLLGGQLYKSTEHRKLLLFISIFLNIGILLISKINGYGFFSPTAWLPSTLPLGVSFYTFQSMSYTIDIYLKRVKPAKSWLHYMSFLSLFPQLLAGPICRARDILPQLENSTTVSVEDKWDALYLIVLGLFKKVIIADYLGTYVEQAFNSGNQYSLYWVVIITAYSFQIYFDFSAYSDIAIGLCRCLGVKIEKNFDHPYFARGLRDFWNRWHISLSHWFRDYVYIPLGGKKRIAFATMLTMLLSAIWHGLGSGFIMWGLLHGTCLIFERKFLRKAPTFILWIWSMIVVWHGWIFFRAKDFSQAKTVFKTIYNGRLYESWAYFWTPFSDLLIFILIAILVDTISVQNKLLKKILICPAVLLILFCYSTGKEFIYFRF